MAWLSGWSKRKEITLTGGASGAQTDFQLSLAVTYDSDMLSDFDDIRFTQSDGTTLIDAWCEVKVDDTSATVWVEFPTTPANTVEESYYMYYGKSDAASDWGIEETFPELSDDFEDGNTTGWVNEGSNTFTADSIAKEGSYGGKCTVAGVTGDETYKTLTATLESVFEFDARFNLNTTYVFMALDETAGSYLNSVFLRISNAGKLEYYDGSYHILMGNGGIVADQWYKFKIVPHATADTFDIWVDGVSKGTGSGTRGDINTGIRAISITGGGVSGGIMYIDNVFNHKYAANPPTYEFGSEESASTGNPFWYYAMLKRRN